MFSRGCLIKKSTKVQICRSLTTCWLFSLAQPMSRNAQEKTVFSLPVGGKNQLSRSREREVCFMCCLQDSHSLSHVPAQNSTVQHVKRRLQFVPVSRYVFSPCGESSQTKKNLFILKDFSSLTGAMRCLASLHQKNKGSLIILRINYFALKFFSIFLFQTHLHFSSLCF